MKYIILLLFLFGPGSNSGGATPFHRCHKNLPPCPPAHEIKTDPTPNPTETAKRERELKFEWYKGKDKLWYYRLKAGNGEILDRSSDGYKNKGDMLHTIDLVKRKAATASVKEVSE